MPTIQIDEIIEIFRQSTLGQMGPLPENNPIRHVWNWMRIHRKNMKQLEAKLGEYATHALVRQERSTKRKKNIGAAMRRYLEHEGKKRRDRAPRTQPPSGKIRMPKKL